MKSLVSWCAPALLALVAWLAPTSPPTLDDARALHDALPRYLQRVPRSARPDGVADWTAESCGSCHTEIYAEWRISTHARAFGDDAQFQEEMKKHRGERDAAWICLNCHTPIEQQQERLVGAFIDGDRGRPVYVANPDFDRRLQAEAVTCAACHVRDGVIVGPHDDVKAPHAVRQDSALLRSETCTQCHQAHAELSDVELACVLDSGTEHAAAAPAGETCQTCHMPEVERRTAIGDVPVRRARRHWFGGSLIPKKAEFAADMERMRAAYPDGLVAEWVGLPARVAPGATVKATFAIENRNAGHTLPTGDPERFLVVTAEAKDASGAVLASRAETIGSMYQWQPLQKLSDTRLARGERRTFDLEFVAPATGAVALRIEASKWRMNRKNFDYHRLEGRYVAGVPFLQLDRTLEVGGH